MVINKTQRTFSIGDHWIYYKIYCGVFIADNILVNVIKPLSEYLIKDSIIHKWFFIRYNDPEPHLRIRFFINDLKDYGVVIEQIKKELSPYIESNEIWNVELHSYKRELERYGTNTIEIAESLFFYDSEMIINVINIKSDEEEYFLFVVKAVNDIFAYFEYDDEKKLHLIEQLRNVFKKEFNVNRTTIKQLDSKYRLLQKKINNTLKVDSDFIFNNLITIKNDYCKPIIKQLINHKKNDTLLVECNELLASYIHMTINRCFRSKQRIYELLVYDVLYRFYKSKIARK